MEVRTCIARKKYVLTAIFTTLFTVPAFAAGQGLSILETPTFTLAAIITLFLIISTVFDRTTHLIVWYLQKKKRKGLEVAARNLIAEITLIGFLSLILLLLQTPIHSICVSHSSASAETWMLLSHVPGCDCCLATTAGVGECFQEERHCGTQFCLCNGIDQCQEEEVTAELRHLLADEAKPQEVSHCDGVLPKEQSTCPDGQYPLISLTALHQVHYFIFAVAVFHVGMGTVMILLASLRMTLWRRWAVEDDENARKVQDGGQGEQVSMEALPATIKQKASKRMSQETFRNLGRLLSMAVRVGEAVATGTSTPLFGDIQPPMRDVSSLKPRSRSAHFDIDTLKREGEGEGGAHTGLGRIGDGVSLPPGFKRPAPRRAATSACITTPAYPQKAAALQESYSEEIDDMQMSMVAGVGSKEEGCPGMLTHSHTEGYQDALLRSAVVIEGEPSGNAPTGHEPMQRRQSAGINLESVQQEDLEKATGEITGVDSTLHEDIHGSASKTSSATSCWLQQGMSPNMRRSATIKSRQGWCWEWLLCIFLQFLPSPVSKQEFLTMRASFTFTHKLPSNFDFMDYITKSMDDEFAEIVGVGVEMWVAMVIFVLVAGPLGWPAVLFLCIGAAVQVLVNAKLVQIIRHVCRGDRAQTLESNIFWFQRPSLFLHPIRLELFLCSFIFATTAFFAAVFGPHSCPLDNAGFYFMTSTWWVGLMLAGYLFFQLSFKTLPVYSLAVQMDGGYTKHILPHSVRSRMLSMAKRVKKGKKDESKRAKLQAGELQGQRAGSGALQQVLVTGVKHTEAAATSLVRAGKLFINPPEHGHS